MLDRFNPVVVFYRTEPEEFFEGKAASITETINKIERILLFNNEEARDDIRGYAERKNVVLKVHSLFKGLQAR